MTQTGRYTKTEALLMMTLCTFAYIDATSLPGESVVDQQTRMRRDIDAALAASPYKDWQVAWGPGLTTDRSNMMFVATKPTTNNYAVIIRGTEWSFWLDWLQDFGAVLGLQSYPYTLSSYTGAAPQIATGTAVGLDQLVQMTGSTSTGTQASLTAFLEQLDPKADIVVTGHSLGGCLATVVAPWLVSVLKQGQALVVYTFAASSAGDSAFAHYYNALFMDQQNQTSTAFRLYNTLAVVPNEWASLAVVESYYTPSPSCTDDIKALIGAVQAIVGTRYAQVGTLDQKSAIPLTARVLAGPTGAAPIDPIGDTLFFFELQRQHATTTYLQLLQAPPAQSALAAMAKLRGFAAAQALHDVPVTRSAKTAILAKHQSNKRR